MSPQVHLVDSDMGKHRAPPAQVHLPRAVVAGRGAGASSARVLVLEVALKGNQKKPCYIVPTQPTFQMSQSKK